MGSMIGSGIFIVSADISRQVNSLAFSSWCGCHGAVTMVAALSYGELASGDAARGWAVRVFARGLRTLTGFLYGWTCSW